jgi:uncharacterized protein
LPRPELTPCRAGLLHDYGGQPAPKGFDLRPARSYTHAASRSEVGLSRRSFRCCLSTREDKKPREAPETRRPASAGGRVLREAGDGRTLPLVCGIFEATALDRRLKGMESPRPLTHDGWAASIEALGGEVRAVIIDDLREYVYHAKARISQGGRLVAVDIRPSDAIVLALVCRVPILVAERLLVGS